MQMPNSFYIVFLCLSSSLFGCNDLNENIFFSSETKTIQLEYRQIFQESPKNNVSGEIFIERPKKFKISTIKPTKTELIMNENEIYRTDFALNETIKYKTSNIEKQIPALFLIKTSLEICKALQELSASNFVNEIDFELDGKTLKKISYKDQFDSFTEINLFNIKINENLDQKIFDYNKDATLIIMN